MFDIFNSKEILANPLLAKDFIKHVPAYELAKWCLNNADENNIIDLEPIVKGIIESDRNDLKLIVATYGKLSHLFKADYLLELFSIDGGHKAALLGNSKINWYSFDDRVTEILKKIFLCDPSISDVGDLRRLASNNPRMDRRLIANAMRGKDDFQALGLTDRLIIGAEAIAINEIPAENWIGKDSPDTHELHFSEPSKAFLPLLKMVKENSSEEDFEYYLSGIIIWKMVNAKIDVETKDWLSADQIKPFNYETYMQDIREEKLRSLQLIFDFFADWYDRDDGFPQEEKHINKVSTAILAIDALLNNFWVRNDVQEIVEGLLIHPSILLRSAGYAKIFNSIKIDEESKGIKDFFISYPENSLEKWMGITCTEAFWLCFENYQLREFLLEKIESSGYAVRFETARNAMYQYLFSNVSDFAVAAKSHNEKFKFINLKFKSVVSSLLGNAFSVDEEKIRRATKNGKGFLGKFFK
jgi:hypothetical protein